MRTARTVALANLALVAFLVCMVIVTAAVVERSAAVGAHGRAPHDRAIVRPGQSR